MPFFDDNFAPFTGIDIGWDGFDPDHPVGEYTVGPDDGSVVSRCGFEPIGLAAVGAEPDGVGLFPGQVHVSQTSTIFAAGGGQAVRIWPLLNGSPLNQNSPPASPIPRVALADGIWLAWVIFREQHPAHLARCEFVTAAAGAPVLSQDEKAYRVAVFNVKNPAGGGTPIVTMDAALDQRQEIDCDLELAIPQHQWRFKKDSRTTFTVEGGFVNWPKGNDSPLIYQSVACAAPPAGTFVLGGAGTIWLRMDWVWGLQLSDQYWHNDKGSGGSGAPPDQYYHAKPNKIFDLSLGGFFDQALPTPGVNNLTHYPASGTVWFKLLDYVDGGAGDVICSQQYQTSSLFMTEMVDLKGCQEDSSVSAGGAFPAC